MVIGAESNIKRARVYPPPTALGASVKSRRPVPRGVQVLLLMDELNDSLVDLFMMREAIKSLDGESASQMQELLAAADRLFLDSIYAPSSVV